MGQRARQFQIATPVHVLQISPAQIVQLVGQRQVACIDSTNKTLLFIFQIWIVAEAIPVVTTARAVIFLTVSHVTASQATLDSFAPQAIRRFLNTYCLLCHAEIDECSSDPCLYGNCSDFKNSFSCTCHPGFTGHLCATGKHHLVNNNGIVVFLFRR